MNPALGKLHPYPFERLSALLAADQPTQPLIDLSIGEPRHPAPEFVLSALRAELAAIANYPNTRGETGLREACAAWLNRRAGLAADAAIDPATQVLPVNGTREALFAIAHCLIDTRRQRPTVVLPNPFYQIYEGATLLAQAEPYYMPCPAEHGHQPNIASVPASVWERCQLVYICTPGNPSGAVMPEDSLRLLLTLAERHDFIIVSDECYGEIYLDEASPPPGLLQVAAASGNTGLERCISFHSLSKRSNVPGLRSGFVAGSQTLIERFALYRTYHGCAMPLHHQRASALAWADEEHVRDNRARYREKFAAVAPILAAVFPVEVPAAGFYLWPATGMDDLEFCQRCYRDAGVKVLPGTFLARTVNGSNPGEARARLALVASLEQCIEAATRIQNCLSQR